MSVTGGLGGWGAAGVLLQTCCCDTAGITDKVIVFYCCFIQEVDLIWHS